MMPAAPTFVPVDLVTKIQFQPSVVLGILGAGALYAWGIRRLAAKGREWSPARSI